MFLREVSLYLDSFGLKERPEQFLRPYLSLIDKVHRLAEGDTSHPTEMTSRCLPQSVCPLSLERDLLFDEVHRLGEGDTSHPTGIPDLEAQSHVRQNIGVSVDSGKQMTKEKSVKGQ